MAVGMAIAERHLNAVYGDDLVDHRTFVIAGDGDLMEGVNHEAVGLAGHLKLGRLIVLWDDNRITIDGSTDLSRNEDVMARHAAGGWHTVECDGLDAGKVASALDEAVADERPSLIRCRTIIGYGAPNKQGTAATHGARARQGRGRGGAQGARAGDRRSSRSPTTCSPRGARSGGAAALKRAEWHRRLDGSKKQGRVPRAHGRQDRRQLAQAAPRRADRQAADGRDAQGVGNGARGDQRGDPGDDRRLGRPDRLEQHQDQGPGAADRGQLRRALHLLRHPRVRHGGGDERHGAARRRDPLRRHLPDLLRLLPPGDPAVGAAERQGHLCDDPRFRSGSARTGRPTSRSSICRACGRCRSSTSSGRPTRSRPPNAGPPRWPATGRRCWR